MCRKGDVKMKWNVKELKEFIKDIDDDYEIVIESIISGEEQYCSDTEDIYSSKDSESGNKLLVFVPKEIQVSGFDDDGIEDFADYLVENAEYAFQHKDRKELISVLERYLK